MATTILTNLARFTSFRGTEAVLYSKSPELHTEQF